MPPASSVPCDESIFPRDPFDNKRGNVKERRITAACIPTYNKRLGSLIGTSSHRRRSSHNPHLDSKDILFPFIVNKFRPHSYCHPRKQSSDHRRWDVWSSSNDHPTTLGASIPPRVPAGERLVREPPLNLAETDNLGIYEALTGSRLKKFNKRCVTCSEDNKPHICEDDLDSSKDGWVSPR